MKSVLWSEVEGNSTLLRCKMGWWLLWFDASIYVDSVSRGNIYEEDFVGNTFRSCHGRERRSRSCTSMGEEKARGGVDRIEVCGDEMV